MRVIGLSPVLLLASIFSVSAFGQSSCSYLVSPTSPLQAPAAGGSFQFTVQTGASCQWTVTNLPGWISVPVAPPGTGTGTVTLVIAPNPGAALSATIGIAGVPVTINQAAGGNCTYQLNPGGQTFPASGGSGSTTVTAAPGCPLSASSATSWITISGINTGTGTVTYQAGVNNGAARSGVINIANQSFTVEEASATTTGLAVAGSMAQLASAGSWATSFTLVNTGSAPALVRLNFFDNNGNPLSLPLTFPQSSNSGGPLLASTLDRTINPGAELVIQTTGPSNQLTQVGWAQLLTNGSVGGFATFTQTVGSSIQDGEVPLETRNAAAYVVPYDNTSASATGIALANTSAVAEIVTMNVRDDAGAVILTDTIALPAMGHTSFNLNDRYAAATGQKRGTLEFRSPSAGQISVLGLRFNVNGAFSTLPSIAE